MVRWFGSGILLADTITKLPPEADGAVVVSGSHGGRYPGYLAARAGVRAVILNDAGLGLDQAGIGALSYLDAIGVAGATVSHLSCRIGDTDDMIARGRISHANAAAKAVGVAPGQDVAAAARRLRALPHRRTELPILGEGRSDILPEGALRRIVLMDSASLVRPDDVGQVVVTGSHGGLIGGDPETALRVDAYAAAFNDAGIGMQSAGTTRLPALDRRNIAAITVSAARIGEGESTFRCGIVSAANRTAKSWGVREGDKAETVLTDFARRA